MTVTGNEHSIPPQPSLSAVLPTLNRPVLLKRAVLSALRQTLKDIEVIVVLDGPDGEASRRALSTISDSRLRVVALAAHRGPNTARNTGIARARGKWIALLDDDDEWFPRKLEAQLEAARRSVHRYPVVTCQMIHRMPGADFIHPRRLPYPGEHISDYLYSRQGLPHSEGFAQIGSMVMAPRDLFLAVPFDERYTSDVDWLLRAFCVEGAGLEMVHETLVVWNDDEDRSRVSLRGRNWLDPYEWVCRRRRFFTPRAYAAFIMGAVSGYASKTHRPGVFRKLYREAVTHGRPSLIDHLVFFYIWFIPESLRHGIRRFLLGQTSTLKWWGGESKVLKRNPDGKPCEF